VKKFIWLAVMIVIGYLAVLQMAKSETPAGDARQPCARNRDSATDRDAGRNRDD
jgi:hypothetical protein